jgi:hypothetical protein
MGGERKVKQEYEAVPQALKALRETRIKCLSTKRKIKMESRQTWKIKISADWENWEDELISLL